MVSPGMKIVYNQSVHCDKCNFRKKQNIFETMRFLRYWQLPWYVPLPRMFPSTNLFLWILTTTKYHESGSPNDCHTSYLSFFYTGKIFGEQNLHRKTPIFANFSPISANLHRNLHRKTPIFANFRQFFALNL